MATTTITTGTTRTTQLTMVGGDALTVDTGGTFGYTGTASAVLWTGGAGTATITVNGTVTAGGAGARAIDSATTLAAGSTLSVAVGAGSNVTSTDDTIRVRVGPANGAVTIVNSGNIVSGAIDGSGVITGATSGQALDLANITIATTTVTVTNNAGATIGAANNDAVRLTPNSTVNNSGRIIAQSVGGATGNDGVDFQDVGAGTVNNFATGTITGARHGIAGKQNITVTNAGTITGVLGSGINLDTLSGTTTITNQAGGTITGNAAGTTDGDSIDVDFLVNIDNAGTIRALGTSNSGSLTEALAIGGGTVVNRAGGLITSAQRAITADDSNLGNAFGATTIDNSGTITGDNGQAIAITGTFADTLTNRGTINGSVVLGDGADIFNNVAGSTNSSTIDGGNGADTVNLLGTGAGTLVGATGFETLNVQSGSWTLAETESYLSGVTVASGSTLRLGSGGTTGDLVASTLADNGTLVFNRSNLLLFTTAISGSGSVELRGTGRTQLTGVNTYAGGTTLYGGNLDLFGATAAGSGAIAFAAATASTLLIGANVTIGNTLVGFDADDRIDLAGFNAATTVADFNTSTNVLAVDDGQGHSTTLRFSGSNAGLYFAAASDGSGGALLSQSTTPCFTPGTAIATGRGDRPVETLAIGDSVLTRDGTSRPIRWIGRRSFAGRFLAGKKHLLPVVIRAGALGDGLPRRDLRISPLHAMFLDGVLVPAWALVNGGSIVQDMACRAVEYIHIELDSHDVILAEGAPAETFLDDDSRGMFHNAAEYAALYPDASGEQPLYCAPRVESGEALEAIRRRIDGVAPARAA